MIYTAGFVLLLVVVYACCNVVYRLFFSPLSKLPGPWLTRISTIPEANALKQHKRARWVTELFDQYPGAVAVRTGPNSVSFNHPDAVKAIYGMYAVSAAWTNDGLIEDSRTWQDSRWFRQVELVRFILDDWRIAVLNSIEETTCREEANGSARL